MRECVRVCPLGGQVVDLDGMAEGNRNRNMRDFANLFGVCDMGAPCRVWCVFGVLCLLSCQLVRNQVRYFDLRRSYSQTDLSG